ncbi:acyl-CoA carboxylase subunit epsilon [Streptomyces sp. B6B3]|uniref:acyl-CoA carboxylase subunit epsilon n=1 Tax=Streptomyces sp. B6B3 TaxID=3153570 RepID=UPI00325D3993
MVGEGAIRVVRGDPTPEELAAAVAVVQARAAALATRGEDEETTPHAPDTWSDPARTLPRPLPAPGPHAWQRSYRPG